MPIVWFLLAMVAIAAPWLLVRALGWLLGLAAVAVLWAVIAHLDTASHCDYACKVQRADAGRTTFGP